VSNEIDFSSFLIYQISFLSAHPKLLWRKQTSITRYRFSDTGCFWISLLLTFNNKGGKDYEIEILVDVRSNPYSRFASQFKKANVQKTLQGNGMKLFPGSNRT